VSSSEALDLSTQEAKISLEQAKTDNERALFSLCFLESAGTFIFTGKSRRAHRVV
jgi:hypothetical protein